MVLYFVFQETPAASIYKTQVVDVINHLNKQFDRDIRFITLIPVKRFFKNRRKIRQEVKTPTYVFPQFPLPRMYGWKLNSFTLWLACLVLRPHSIICRGPFASWLANSIKPYSGIKKVIFDSRGVVTEEAKEYGIYPKHIIRKAEQIEKSGVLKSEFLMTTTRFALSYYIQHFGYRSRNNVIIPCTLGTDFEQITFDKDTIDQMRNAYGYSDSDIVLVYSGSNAKWQSFDLMLHWAEKILIADSRVKLLLLTKQNDLTTAFIGKFPGRVMLNWLSGNELIDNLSICDYGLLIREPTVTNSVSSPTKFAEYLACGLRVIANDTMAVSETIVQNKAGILLEDDKNEAVSELSRTGVSEKIRLNGLANSLFGKNAVGPKEGYQKILNL